MTLRVARGTALRQHRVMVRFGKGVAPGPRQDHKLAERLVEVRKLLRTDMSIAEIAEDLGVALQTLRGFIKRRRLCNMTERSGFISLQKSLAKMDQSQ